MKILIGAFSGMFKKRSQGEDVLRDIELPLWISFVGLPIGLVIVPAEMEKSVYYEMGKVMKEKPSFSLAFPFERLVSDDDVAKQPGVLAYHLT